VTLSFWSDCTRRPSPGLCSLTGLEAVLGGWSCAIGSAPRKVTQLQTSAGLVPSEASLAELWRAARNCKACDLWKMATQTVFGEGPSSAAIMFVGEQPGDMEDLSGHPFVGPAGKLFDRALADAGIERSEVYVTNIVKHFKWSPAKRGKRRIHEKPHAFGDPGLPALARSRVADN